jgi:ribonuclease P protein component
MGLIVPRFQFSAVARNRLRRRLKEIWRRDIQGDQPGWDVLLRAKREAYAADFEELRAAVVEWRSRTIGDAGAGNSGRQQGSGET